MSDPVLELIRHVEELEAQLAATHAAIRALPRRDFLLARIQLPVRWDGADLLDATNRIIVWGKTDDDDRDDVDRSLGKWVAETLNATDALARLLGDEGTKS